MAAFLFRAVSRQDGAPPTGSAVLPDVGEGVWYRQFAEWAVSSGVIPLVDGRFNPGGVVSRADMAVILAAAFPDLIPQGDATGVFADTAGLSDNTIRAVEDLYRAGVTSGCSADSLRYCPNQPVTRAQMASFFVRTLSDLPTTISWGASITAPEGTPADEADNFEWPSQPIVRSKLILSRATQEDIELEIWPRTGTDGCRDITLPDDTAWAEPDDYGRSRWRDDDGQRPQVTIKKGNREVTFPIWWMADWEQEPDEMFCVTILGGPPEGIQWENPDRTVLPVTLQNDDEPIEIRWGKSIMVPEGDPDSEGDNRMWPYRPVAETVLYLDDPAQEDITLNIWPRFEDGCPGLEPPENTVWGDPTDYGRPHWRARANDGLDPTRVTIEKGDQQVDVEVWWSADWEQEPNEMFCITIRGGLPRALRWKDNTSPVLPVILENDD